MISARGITKKYGNGVTALNGVDISVGKGETFSLLGPNGAGKSSLIGILSALSRPTTGTVSIGGEEPLKSAHSVMRRIGVSPQNVCLDPDETPRRLLDFQGRLFGLGSASRGRADELIALFRLEPEAEKKTSSLSGGNQRRLHIALSLVHRPEILFLDEPTVGMDPESRALFWDSIRSLNTSDRTTIFLTTQYLDEAEKNTMTMALLINGKIEWHGGVRNFISTVRGKEQGHASSLEDSYLHFISRFREQEKTA